MPPNQNLSLSFFPQFFPFYPICCFWSSSAEKTAARSFPLLLQQTFQGFCKVHGEIFGSWILSCWIKVTRERKFEKWHFAILTTPVMVWIHEGPKAFGRINFAKAQSSKGIHGITSKKAQSSKGILGMYIPQRGIYSYTYTHFCI